METEEFDDLEMSFDFDTVNFDVLNIEDAIETRIHKPKLFKARKDRQIVYTDALKMAKEIDLLQVPRYDALINGSFIFGDFIEAWMVNYGVVAKDMVISTLSMSHENVGSLKTLLEKGYIHNLTLIVSDYFFSHEKNGIIKYAYEELDIDNRFQLSVARTHTKIVYFETPKGTKVVMHGSANLRSSDNIEQFTIEINNSLFDFYKDFYDNVIETYKTINKSVRNKEIKRIFVKVEEGMKNGKGEKRIGQI